MRSGQGIFRVFLVGVLTMTVALAGAQNAFADTTCDTCSNTQDGDNAADASSGGASGSGDAVGGQVTGIVSSGDASVDAKNRSEKADIESGQAVGSNSSAAFAGLAQSDTDSLDVSAEDVVAGGADVNALDGDNEFVLSQTASASSGDGVAGQVIGVVTSSGGSADVVADNASKKIDVETGAADASNSSDAFVGLALASDDVEIGPEAVDVTATATGSLNAQDGDNAQDVTQSSDAASGDGVGGQVLGVVSAGDASLDARNRSEKVDLDTGDATADNNTSGFTGLARADDDIEVADVTANGGDVNAQEGDNDQSVDQAATASSGDAVGGQVAGIVTSAGGSADVVADNASKKADVGTSDASANNVADAFVGLALADEDVEVGPEAEDVDVISDGELNVQEGDNGQDISQSSDATTGDGVGGQVLGVVSAGDASLDARNRSEKVDLETGPADASSDATGFTGLALADDNDIEVADVTASSADELNAQDGDNDQSIDQAATASSGDAVGGQVAGIVTSAGGSADVVADNASKKVDVDTGDADADNDVDAFVGLALAEQDVEIGPEAADVDVTAGDDSNVQEGDNSQDISQSSDATTGDGVGGQVLGVVSAGDASLDARNRSEKVDLDTGDAIADHEAHGLAGLAFVDSDDIEIADVDAVISGGGDVNAQEGDNDQSIDQAATASSGDAVGGQVAGIVTSAGGSADVVADNASKKVDVETGEADADNDVDAFVGLALADNDIEIGPGAVDVDVTAGEEANVQEGDNSQGLSQSADATTGDGVGGQVLGVVSAGDAALDARNRSEKTDLETGSADASNDATGFTGLAQSDDDDIEVDDVTVDGGAVNAQEGDNDQGIGQTATASSGDAVGGQVAGIVTSAGGSADVVADNASKKIDVSTGEADASNDVDAFVGLALADSDIEIGPGAVDVDATAGGDLNAQEGDNGQDITQSAASSTGDGVGGQVLGVVSAGDASLDARNRSEKIDLETGDATADNAAQAFVGLANTDDDNVEVGDVTAGAGEESNVQDGDNDQSLDQTAEASSGDAVGGQVAGVVTSAGGSADLVLDNASKKIDGESGDAEFDNDEKLFVGLSVSEGDLFIRPFS